MMAPRADKRADEEDESSWEAADEFEPVAEPDAETEHCDVKAVRVRRSIERFAERRALLAAIADGFGEDGDAAADATLGSP